MKRGQRYASVAAALAGLVLASCGTVQGNPVSDPTPNNVPRLIAQPADQLTAALEAQGFEVLRGYFKLYSDADCTVSFSVMHTCFGNNPAAPYVLFGVPPWPNEFVDPASQGQVGVIAPGYEGTFRFDPREAIVVLALTPPPGAYYGVQTYDFTRQGTFDTASPTYQTIAGLSPAFLRLFFETVPYDTKRIQLFASVGNNTNNVVVQQQSGEAFDQQRVFISTPDQDMDVAIRGALNRIGIPTDSILTEPIPASPGDPGGVHVGLDASADDFLWVMRYAHPLDGGGAGTASAQWRKDLPLVVLRVRDPNQERVPQTYGPSQLDPRIAHDEHGLQDDLTKLVAAVNARWGQPCAATDCSDRGAQTFLDPQVPPINMIGPDCIAIGMDCIGDNQDTTYEVTPSDKTLNNDEIYAVIGTLGTETGNATYVGLSVNDSYLLKGVADISDTLLKGTALPYASQVNNADKFYVYYIARNCSGLDALTDGHCLTVTNDMIPRCTDPTTQTCHTMKLIQREYIVPGTRRGPDTTLTLMPRIVPLTRPAP